MDITIGNKSSNDSCPLCTSPLSSDSRIQLPCCLSAVCSDCTAEYIRVRIESGEHSIPCPSTECTQELSAEVINQFTTERQQHRLELLKVNASKSTTKRACPNCSHIKTVSAEAYRRMKKAYSSAKDSDRLNQTICEACDVPWCYYCYGPAHPGASCKKSSDGSSLFNNWVNDWDGSNNQKNAFKCPGCGIPTQRDGGCPNMNCNNCACYWCYHCGKKTTNSSLLYGTHSGTNWNINACDRMLIFGNKKTTRRLRRFKLAQEIIVLCVCGLAIGIVYLPLLPLALLVAPPIILLVLAARSM